jgi:pimeloyl-ACP methyl ester carboxylesterase
MSDLERVHIEHWGDAGPCVVMVHGGAQGTQSAGHRNFHAQEPLGREGWRVMVPDRPGHGRSPDPGRPDDAEADAGWVAELLGDGAHLLGHSFGGLVAVAAAALRPEAVKSLVLVEPALFAVATKSTAVKKQLAKMAFTMVVPFSPASRARRIMALLGIPNVFALTDADLSALGSSLKRGVFPKRANIKRWFEEIRRAKIPVLIISSGSNAAFEAMGRIVAEQLGAKHEVVPIEHHFPQWNAAPFNALISNFWRQSEDLRRGA